MISAEPHGEDPRVIAITRGGIVTGEDIVTLGKTTEETKVGKPTEKTQVFDARKQKQTFEEVRKEFGKDRGSSSKT
jgi:hypothetical protein